MEFVKIFTGYLHRKMLCFVPVKYRRNREENWRNFRQSCKETESTFFASEICAKRHFTKCKKYVIMILCIPCAFPTDSQSNFMLYFNNFTIHRKKALPMQKRHASLVYVFPAYRKNTDCNVSKHSINMLLQKDTAFYIQCKIRLFLPPCGGSPPRQNAVHACRICRK